MAGFSVWIVDGNYIRNNIDFEFTNYGQHYRFKFIPKNEFWIDKQINEGEEEFFIDHLLVENRLMAEGVNYSDAIDKADRIEKRERNQSKLMTSIMAKKLSKKEIVEKIHKKLIKKFSKKIKIWIVDGELVRDVFNQWYTEGGHDLKYPFIPKNEIWIDDDLSKKEIPFIVLHEVHERRLMSKGWCYDKDLNNLPYIYEPGKKIKASTKKNPNFFKSAHRSASHIEYFCRHNPKRLNAILEREINSLNEDNY